VKPGLWVNERSYVELSESALLSNELATRQRCEYTYMIDQLPDPDQVLRKLGRDITVYDEMLTDPHIGSCIDSRKSGTKKRLWEIDRGKSKSCQARLIEDIFSLYSLRNLINEILDSIWYGFQPIEIMWEKRGGMIVPARLVGKPPRWFRFDNNNNLLLVTKENRGGERVPERKFVVAQNDPRFENPYGVRAAARCFWYHRFKKNGLKWWVVFAEKFGMPWILAKTPRGSDERENENVLAMLEKMVQDAIGVVPDDSSVEAMKLERSASVTIYDRLLAYCEASISKAILGHSAGADSTPGRLGNETMAMEARDDLIENDCSLVESVLNQVIDWTIEINFGPSIDRPKFILYEEDDVDHEQAVRDKALADTGQLIFTEAYFRKTYGFDKGDIIVVDPPAQRAPAAELSEPSRTGSWPATDQDDVDALLDSLSPAQLQSQAEQLLGPVIELIENASSYEDVMAALVELYPRLDDSKLQQRLTWATTLARLRGRIATTPPGDM
jgi:phage gp29-like protein